MTVTGDPCVWTRGQWDPGTTPPDGAIYLPGCNPFEFRLVRGPWRWPSWCPLCEARLVRADEPYPPVPEEAYAKR